MSDSSEHQNELHPIIEWSIAVHCDEGRERPDQTSRGRSQMEPRRRKQDGLFPPAPTPSLPKICCIYLNRKLVFPKKILIFYSYYTHQQGQEPSVAKKQTSRWSLSTSSSFLAKYHPDNAPRLSIRVIILILSFVFVLSLQIKSRNAVGQAFNSNT